MSLLEKTGQICKSVNPYCLGGPILDKELRCAGRKFRTYITRSLYIALLGFAIYMIYDEVGSSAPSGMAMISMVSISMSVVLASIQFILCNLFAISSLSSSVSDEVTKNTLGSLLTTPMSSFQICLGKLLAGVFRIMIFILISLPILSIIRLNGGVPAEFILTSIILTICSVLLSGALSLRLSVTNLKSANAAVSAFLSQFLLFLILPWLLSLLGFLYNQNLCTMVAGYIQMVSPYYVFYANSVTLCTALPQFDVSMLPSVIFCLAATLLLLLDSARRVKQASFAHISKPKSRGFRAFLFEKRFRLYDLFRNRSKIRSVTGCPIMWKELKAPQTSKMNFLSLVFLTIILFAFGCGYILLMIFHSEDWVIHSQVAVVCLAIGGFSILSAAAGSIVREKEARTWPILLTIPMDDNQIIFAKAKGIFRLTLPVWIFLFAHLAIFTIAGAISVYSLILAIFPVANICMFFMAIGLVSSMNAKKASVATSMSIAFIFLFWIVIPFFLSLFSLFKLAQWYWYGNPFYQMVAIFADSSPSRFNIASNDADSFVISLIFMVIYSAVYFTVSWVMVSIAKQNIREKLFTV